MQILMIPPLSYGVELVAFAAITLACYWVATFFQEIKRAPRILIPALILIVWGLWAMWHR
jgi:hypothetical protein